MGDKWEQSKCRWNPHTELCRQYKEKLASLDPDVLQLESEYREWRKRYLAGPRKPSFKYPSSRKLPMPKIFGERFYEVDMTRSVLRLRLDDMSEGQWIEFGFVAWPRKYPTRRSKVQIKSVHVNFVGSRARVGFRFDVPHRESRFACSQDEIDELRSRVYPRQAQDQLFLDAAKKRLVDSYSGDSLSDLRLLAVDLGEKGAAGAIYQGTKWLQDIQLEIIKIDRCYAEEPSILKKDLELASASGKQPPPAFNPKQDTRGLRKEHVGRHLTQLADRATQVAEYRRAASGSHTTLRTGDFRGLKRHIAWMIRDWVRLNAARVVAEAEKHECDLIVLESLRGFKPPGFDKLDVEDERKKRWLAMFSYGRIRHKVSEKAVERGMRVITVPYFKSSQFCSDCLHEQSNKGLWTKNKRKHHRFKCECKEKPDNNCNCSIDLNSDANAARVLARVFWGEFQLPLPQDV